MTRGGARPNSVVLRAVALALEPILDSLTFVGGQVVELLITDRAAVAIRATLDVDAVAPAASTAEFRRVERALVDLGFTREIRGGVICRWQSPAPGRHSVDIMPVEPGILGFSNRWYGMAVEGAQPIRLIEGPTIRIPRPAVFLATKLEAFLGRGRGDLLRSHDLEDVIALIAGRPELRDELKAESPVLREWVSGEIRRLLDNPDFPYAIEGALRDTGEISGFYSVMLGSFEALVTSGD